MPVTVTPLDNRNIRIDYEAADFPGTSQRKITLFNRLQRPPDSSRPFTEFSMGEVTTSSLSYTINLDTSAQFSRVGGLPYAGYPGAIVIQVEGVGGTANPVRILHYVEPSDIDNAKYGVRVDGVEVQTLHERVWRGKSPTSAIKQSLSGDAVFEVSIATYRARDFRPFQLVEFIYKPFGDLSPAIVYWTGYIREARRVEEQRLIRVSCMGIRESINIPVSGDGVSVTGDRVDRAIEKIIRNVHPASDLGSIAYYEDDALIAGTNVNAVIAPFSNALNEIIAIERQNINHFTINESSGGHQFLLPNDLWRDGTLQRYDYTSNRSGSPSEKPGGVSYTPSQLALSPTTKSVKVSDRGTFPSGGFSTDETTTTLARLSERVLGDELTVWRYVGTLGGAGTLSEGAEVQIESGGDATPTLSATIGTTEPVTITGGGGEGDVSASTASAAASETFYFSPFSATDTEPDIDLQWEGSQVCPPWGRTDRSPNNFNASFTLTPRNPPGNTVWDRVEPTLFYRGLARQAGIPVSRVSNAYSTSTSDNLHIGGLNPVITWTPLGSANSPASGLTLAEGRAIAQSLSANWFGTTYSIANNTVTQFGSFGSNYTVNLGSDALGLQNATGNATVRWLIIMNDGTTRYNNATISMSISGTTATFRMPPAPSGVLLNSRPYLTGWSVSGNRTMITTSGIPAHRAWNGAYPVSGSTVQHQLGVTGVRATATIRAQGINALGNRVDYAVRTVNSTISIPSAGSVAVVLDIGAYDDGGTADWLVLPLPYISSWTIYAKPYIAGSGAIRGSRTIPWNGSSSFSLGQGTPSSVPGLGWEISGSGHSANVRVIGERIVGGQPQVYNVAYTGSVSVSASDSGATVTIGSAPFVPGLTWGPFAHVSSINVRGRLYSTEVTGSLTSVSPETTLPSNLPPYRNWHAFNPILYSVSIPDSTYGHRIIRADITARRIPGEIQNGNWVPLSWRGGAALRATVTINDGRVQIEPQSVSASVARTDRWAVDELVVFYREYVTGAGTTPRVEGSGRIIDIGTVYRLTSDAAVVARNVREAFGKKFEDITVRAVIRDNLSHVLFLMEIGDLLRLRGSPHIWRIDGYEKHNERNVQIAHLALSREITGG